MITVFLQRHFEYFSVISVCVYISFLFCCLLWNCREVLHGLHGCSSFGVNKTGIRGKKIQTWLTTSDLFYFASFLNYRCMLSKWEGLHNSSAVDLYSGGIWFESQQGTLAAMTDRFSAVLPGKLREWSRLYDSRFSHNTVNFIFLPSTISFTYWQSRKMIPHRSRI